MAVSHDCDGCGAHIEGEDVEAFLARYVEHTRTTHADWGYSDKAVRAYARRWFVPDDGEEP
jgi:hypothetical protein